MRKQAANALTAVGVLAALVLVGVAHVAAAGPPRPSPRLLREIDALRAEKAARTAAQRKVGSRLLFAARSERERGRRPAGWPQLRSGLARGVDGSVEIDLRGDLDGGVAARVRDLGGRVVSRHPGRGRLRARLPLQAVEALAELPQVHAVRPAGGAYTRMIDVSEGDEAHRADQVRSVFAVDGSGVKVGVLSDGVDALLSLQASGDLPAVTILPGQAGAGSEGTAMLEIVHDLAPGAELLFATAFNGQASFANNILALRGAGADVIVDDVGYFAEAVFQDDDVAESVDTVVADGALYFSSAGNSGNLNDGTAGVWEGDFTSGFTVNGEPALDFGDGGYSNQVVQDTPFVFTLHWSDPLGGSANDYDLYLADPTLSFLLDASTGSQDGNDDPFEQISSTLFDDTGNHLIVTRFSGTDRMLHLNTNRGRLALATAGQTSGHAAARGALGVAAVDARTAPVGGFDGSESVETFSSDGPRRVFFEADGTPITPGDLSTSGGELRAKPDLAAADCVSTATPGFAVFCGTSAAAPHAAAIAALLIEKDGGPGVADPQEIREALLAGTFDIEAPGPDRDAGAGLVDAFFAAAGADVDGDGVANGDDNCIDVANADQTDSDGDFCGNACDADYDGNGFVGLQDFNLFRAGFGRALGDPNYVPDLDHDGDDVIGLADFNRFRTLFEGNPGPSGTTPGTVACP